MSTSPTYGMSDVDLAFAVCEVFGWRWVEVWDYSALCLAVALEAYYAIIRRRKGGWSMPPEAAIYSAFGEQLIKASSS